MRVMISQPMYGRKDEDVLEERKELIEKFKKMHIEVVNSFDTKAAPAGIYNLPVYYLGRTIMNWLHSVDAVFFTDGWQEARGCRIEHEICKEYDIKCLYSDFFITDVNSIPKISGNVIIKSDIDKNLPIYPQVTYETYK